MAGRPRRRERSKGTADLRKRVDALIHSKGTIDQFVLLTDIVEVFGGPRQMAVQMHQEYQNAPSGGIARQKFWQMVQHLIIRSTEMNLTKVLNASQMTDDELEAYLSQFLIRTLNGNLVSPSAPPQEKAQVQPFEDADDSGPELDEADS